MTEFLLNTRESIALSTKRCYIIDTHKSSATFSCTPACIAYAAAYWSVVAQAQIHSWSSVTKHLHVVCYRNIW